MSDVCAVVVSKSTPPTPQESLQDSGILRLLPERRGGGLINEQMFTAAIMTEIIGFNFHNNISCRKHLAGNIDAY